MDDRCCKATMRPNPTLTALGRRRRANEVAAEMREALGMDISTNDVQMGIEQVWAGPETSRPRAPSRRGLVCSASGRGSRG